MMSQIYRCDMCGKDIGECFWDTAVVQVDRYIKGHIRPDTWKIDVCHECAGKVLQYLGLPDKPTE